MELKEMLKNEKDVQEFVQAATVCPEAIDLKSGAIYLDAKSLLGVMSMGMKREMQVLCSNYDPVFVQSVRKFAVA